MKNPALMSLIFLLPMAPSRAADEHWELAESPIILSSALVVAAGDTLHIDAGMEVRCPGPVDANADMYGDPPPVTLTNSPDGPQLVEVLGRNSAGVWQETPAAVTWTVLPPVPARQIYPEQSVTGTLTWLEPDPGPLSRRFYMVRTP